jgi:hypothetical protein
MQGVDDEESEAILDEIVELWSQRVVAVQGVDR